MRSGRALAQDRVGLFRHIFDLHTRHGAIMALEAPIRNRCRARCVTSSYHFVWQKYCKLYPAAVRCLLSDCEQLTSYLRFPLEHHKRIRHSNFERTFGETRRRVKVIGRLPGEASCLGLVWAVLDRASRGWRGLTTTSHSTRQLQDLRRQLLDPPAPIRRQHPAAATAPPENVGAVA